MSGDGGWKVIEALDEPIMARIRSSLATIKQPAWNDRVRKTECVLSFDTPESPNGLFVSMQNFQGYGADFVGLDHSRTSNALYLNIKWKKIPKEDTEMKKEDEAPTKMAIGMEGGFQVEEQFEYEKSNFLAVMPEKVLIALPQPELPELVSMIADGILKASDLSTDEEQVMAWEEKRQVSKYAETMIQLDNGKKISPDPSTWVCEDSGLNENLWLNLHDGYIGSGRPQFDGSGGTGAALRHYEAEKAKGNNFPLAVKLGTITPNGADVYSYAPDEDDMVEDPQLAKHLAHWGINMMKMEKTEKTMAELQINMNMKFDLDKICEAGKTLQPVSGPGYVGLKNLGNSCYVNSVVQVLCSLPEVKARYQERAKDIFDKSPVGKSADDFSTQMAKVAVGLLTDRYVEPVKEGEENGSFVIPQMFKLLVGKGHAEFSTGNQQDAYEYWQWLSDRMERAERVDGLNLEMTHKAFELTIQSKLTDMQSNKVKYSEAPDRFLSLSIPLDAATNEAEVKDYEERCAKRQKSGDGEGKEEEAPVRLKVPMHKCLESWGTETMVDGWKSPVTGQLGVAAKATRISSFPKYLLCHIRRYILAEDWSPKKLDVLISSPESIDLEFLRGNGAQPGEELLPEDAPGAGGGAGGGGAASSRIVPDEATVRQLMDMGFAENGCRRAAVATNNAGADAAMEWVLAHMEDPDFNDPLPEEGAGGGGAGGEAAVSAEAVEMLCAMGFQKKHAERALKQTGGDLERAGDWLLSRVDMLDTMEDEPQASAPPAEAAASEKVEYKPQYELVAMISHIGGSTASGHYVCHIKKEGRWCIFNDRKVAVSEEPPLEMAYMYLYRSVGPA